MGLSWTHLRGVFSLVVRDPSSSASAYARALTDPGALFSSPEGVLSDEQLTEPQKIEILRRWAYDADELAVAEEEGMSGNGQPLLERILLALEQLGAAVDTEHSPPTKQGGI